MQAILFLGNYKLLKTHFWLVSFCSTVYFNLTKPPSIRLDPLKSNAWWFGLLYALENTTLGYLNKTYIAVKIRYLFILTLWNCQTYEVKTFFYFKFINVWINWQKSDLIFCRALSKTEVRSWSSHCDILVVSQTETFTSVAGDGEVRHLPGQPEGGAGAVGEAADGGDRAGQLGRG